METFLFSPGATENPTLPDETVKQAYLGVARDKYPDFNPLASDADLLSALQSDVKKIWSLLNSLERLILTNNFTPIHQVCTQYMVAPESAGIGHGQLNNALRDYSVFYLRACMAYPQLTGIMREYGTHKIRLQNLLSALYDARRAEKDELKAE